MKSFYVFIVGFLFISVSYAQIPGGFDSFEDGSLENWTNSDGSVTLLTNEVNDPPPGKHLQKICDDTDTPVGRMAISNTSQWTGNFWGDGGGINAVTDIIFYVKNTNAFDLHIRLGLLGADNTKIVSTTPQIIPAFSNWMEIGLVTGHEVTVVSGSNTIEEVLMDVQEMRLLHSTGISFEGDIVDGVLKIDDIGALVLSTTDFLKENISIYPNPSTDFVLIKLPNGNKGIVDLYNTLGEKVSSHSLNSDQTRVDISALNSGIYFANIRTETVNSTKKIIKL